MRRASMPAAASMGFALGPARGLGRVPAGTMLRACYRLDLLHAAAGSRGSSVSASSEALFGFGTDLFLSALGWQLLSASQVMLISRFMGLEAVTIYVICTKTFNLAQQLAGRLFDFSTAGLSEMLARGELDRLKGRFRDLLVVTGGASIFLGIVVAVCNQSFIAIWMRGKISWNPLNDWLLAGVTVTFSLNRTYGWMAWVMKRMQVMRYIYFIEGMVFVSVGILLIRRFGFPGLLATSLVSDWAVSGVFGLRLVQPCSGLKASDLLKEGLLPCARFFVLFCPIGIMIWVIGQTWAPLPRALPQRCAGGSHRRAAVLGCRPHAGVARGTWIASSCRACASGAEPRVVNRRQHRFAAETLPRIQGRVPPRARA